MSIYSDGLTSKLGDIIEYLKKLPRDMVVKNGMGYPHSYRGYYEDLAFSPQENITVAEMLKNAKSAVGKTFQGYKGGEFKMTRETDCWLAEYGSCGVPIIIPGGEFFILPAVPASSDQEGK